MNMFKSLAADVISTTTNHHDIIRQFHQSIIHTRTANQKLQAIILEMLMSILANITVKSSVSKHNMDTKLLNEEHRLSIKA